MTNAPVNAEMIWRFLSKTLGRKDFHVYAIDPLADEKGGCRGRASSDHDAIEDFIFDKQAERQGIFFAVNTPRPGRSKRAKRKDLELIHGVHVDCDPPSPLPDDLESWQDKKIYELRNCPRITGRPIVWISGAGVQGLWLYKKPLKATPESVDETEEINMRLAAEFGGDRNTYDAARILRLPGTQNFPSLKKQRAGRVDSDCVFVHDSADRFRPEDFNALPQPLREHTAKANPKRVDYTARPYSPDYEPLEAEELEREYPDIIDRVHEHFAEKSDRSASCQSFIVGCLTAIMDRLGCSAVDMLKDLDVRKNVAHLVWDAAPDFVLDHYEDQKDGRGRVGYDISKAVGRMADEGRTYTPGGEVRRAWRSEMAGVAKEAPEDIAVHDARRLFLDYVDGAVQPDDLPNTTGGARGSKQLATESNVREMLRLSKISAVWDIMRDEVRFRVSGKAGGKLKGGKPAKWFARALSKLQEGDKAKGEMELILDCFARHGVTQRSELPNLLSLIARENYVHPMEEYCTARPWDGKRRIRALADRLETDNPLAGRYLEIFFRQAVAVVASLDRYLESGEGEMISSVVVLNGPQGIGKTQFWDALIPPRFKSQGSTLKLGSNKETDSIAEVLSGVIANLDEMHTLLRSDHEAFKNFMSMRLDRYRVAYARHPIVKPRMTAFCGTSNAIQLGDPTGSRRLLIMALKSIDLRGLDAIDLQQYYAEAWADVMGELAQTWWLDRDEDAIRTQQNAVHQISTEEEEAVNTYFNHVTDQFQNQYCTATQICKAIDVRYSPTRWANVKKSIENEGCTYKAKIKDLRKVWLFPVHPERWSLISTV